MTVERVRRADAGDLIAANRENVQYHAPWVAPFTDEAGFEQWFARGIAGPHVSLIVRERATRQLVGVVTFSEIVMGIFRSAYLGY